jgi:hypothetical protein
MGLQTVSIWPWIDGGAAKMLAEFEQHGLSVFHDPSAIDKCADPLAFGEALFGERPIRYQRMLVEPSQQGNQKTLPKTMFAGELHNDCAQLGLPPHVQVMVCEKQSAEGGESLMLDMWAVLQRIAVADPALLHDLFHVPRALMSGHMTRYGLTWSLCRGNLVCVHPSRARSGRVGLAFQRYIDESAPAVFKCFPGDVYVNNNHRCLHGRRAFTDPTRRFERLLFWFAKPLAAPAQFIELARAGSAQLAQQLAGEPLGVRQLWGVDAVHAMPNASTVFEGVLHSLLNPRNSDEWQGPGQRHLLLQEAVLSALWNAVRTPALRPEEMAAKFESLVGRDG